MRCLPWICIALWVLPLQAQLFSPGKLAQSHSELEGLRNCTQCHQLGERISETRCLDCHDALAARIRADLGYHALLKDQNCIDCHSDHRGINYAMVRWDSTHFDHDSTGYALTGNHLQLDCAQCHQTPSYLGLEQDCLSCHEDQHRGQLANDCAQCHSTESWGEVDFDHDQSQFSLIAKHRDVACQECHLSLEEGVGANAELKSKKNIAAKIPARRYKNMAFAECADCHSDYHQAQFAQDCATCHNEHGWQPVAFDHNRATYPLHGAHIDVECEKCHLLESFADGNLLRRYKPIRAAQCIDCHADSHRPSLSTDCESCHVVADWHQAGSTFDHNKAHFQLVDKHQSVPCEQCHKEGQFRELAFANCSDCHSDYHRAQFAQDCATCHGENDWQHVAFDHDRATFHLDGAHLDVECEKCHHLESFAEDTQLRRYKPVNAECQDCHGAL